MSAPAAPRRPAPWVRALAFLLPPIAVGLWLYLPRQRSAQARIQRHLAAGAQYARQGQGRRAEQEWRSAVDADPKSAPAWELLGELYLSTRNMRGAAEAFEHLVALAPETPGAHSRLATALYGLGIEAGAFQNAEKALKADPNDTASLAILVFLYGQSGNEARQIECLQRLTALTPGDPEFVSLYAQLLTVRARYAEARPWIERLEKLRPGYHLPYSLRGVIALNEDPSPAGTQKAIALFEEAIRREPRAPFPQLYLGKAYLRLRQPAKAKQVLEEAARLIPGKMDLQFELARAYTALGEREKAAQARARFQALRNEVDRASALRKRASADPNDFAAHKEFGLMNYRAGDYRKAALYLTRARVLRPDDAEVRDALETLQQSDPLLQPARAIPSPAP